MHCKTMEYLAQAALSLLKKLKRRRQAPVQKSRGLLTTCRAMLCPSSCASTPASAACQPRTSSRSITIMPVQIFIKFRKRLEAMQQVPHDLEGHMHASLALQLKGLTGFQVQMDNGNRCVTVNPPVYAQPFASAPAVRKTLPSRVDALGASYRRTTKFKVWPCKSGTCSS